MNEQQYSMLRLLDDARKRSTGYRIENRPDDASNVLIHFLNNCAWVTDDMRIARRSLFILPIISYHSIEDAITYVNARPDQHFTILGDDENSGKC